MLLNFSHCIPNSCGSAILINNKANCIVLSKKYKDSILFLKKFHTLLQTEN